jgi:hypothetical protein
MRKDSPLVACIAAALVLLGAGALSLPGEAWSAGSTALHLAPSLLTTTVQHGQVAAGALRVGVFSAPALFQDRALEPSRPERPVRVCEGERYRSCPQAQAECARMRLLRRIPVLVPTSG